MLSNYGRLTTLSSSLSLRILLKWLKEVNWIASDERDFNKILGDVGFVTNVGVCREGAWWEAKNSSSDPQKVFTQVWGAVRQRAKKGKFGRSLSMDQSDTVSYSCEVRQLPSHLSDIRSLFSREIKQEIWENHSEGEWEEMGYKLKTRKLSTNLPIV